VILSRSFRVLFRLFFRGDLVVGVVGVVGVAVVVGVVVGVCSRLGGGE